MIVKHVVCQWLPIQKDEEKKMVCFIFKKWICTKGVRVVKHSGYWSICSWELVDSLSHWNTQNGSKSSVLLIFLPYSNTLLTQFGDHKKRKVDQTFCPKIRTSGRLTNVWTAYSTILALHSLFRMPYHEPTIKQTEPKEY